MRALRQADLFETPAAPEPSAGADHHDAVMDHRAGAYTMEQLQAMLAPLLVSDAADSAAPSRRKWPLLHSILLVLGSSVLLWALILFGLSRLF